MRNFFYWFLATSYFVNICLLLSKILVHRDVYHFPSKIYISFGNMIVDLCPNYGDYLLGFESTIDFTD